MDWTQYPPPDRYGLVGVNYPTPCPADIILIEETPLRNLNPSTIPPNTPHHRDTSCFLTWQGPAHGNGNDMNVRRMFANDRLAQEQYNLDQLQSDLSNSDYPVFVRSYLEPRGYTPQTLGQPLTRLTGIRVTAAGTTALANGKHALTIAPPISGTTATGVFQVLNGKVIGAYLTNSGSGYDSDSLPSVSAPSTTGVTIVITMQPKACFLTDETESKSEEMMQGRFVRVQRRWERIPGPLLTGMDTDEQSGIITDYTKQVISPGSLTSGIIGSVVTGLNIINPGTGATSSTVTLTIAAPGGGGTTATGTATITLPVAGSIGSVPVTNPGTSYTYPPDVAVSGAGGSGWTGHSLLQPSQIASFIIGNPGNDLTDVPILLIEDDGGDGPGTGARATATLIATSLDSSYTIIPATGIGYDGTSTCTISAPDVISGTQASVSLVLDGAGAIVGLTWNDVGSGYKRRPSVVVDPGTSGGFAADIQPLPLAGTGIDTITLNATGSLYRRPTLTVIGSSTAAISVRVRPTGVDSVVTDTAGIGFSQVSVIATFTNGGGGGAAATPLVATGYLSAVSLTTPGSLYKNAPAVTVSAAGLTGAIVRATIGSRTYVKVTPINSLKSVALLSSIRKSSLPPTRSFKVSVRVKFPDFQLASLEIISASKGVDVGLIETSINKGSGTMLADMYEMYMDESDYEAYVPAFGLSHSGQSNTFTLLTFAIVNDFPKIWTFRVTPITGGDTAGLMDLARGERLNLGIRRIIAIVLPTNAFRL